MKSKMNKLLASVAVVLGTAVGAQAAPVFFDIELIATSGLGGTGSFSVDSADLANIPAAGAYFSGNNVDNFTLTIGTVVFDTVTSSNWTASNGQITGLTGLCCSDFTSSTTPGAELETNTGGGAPNIWSANVNGLSLGSGATYSVTLAVAAVPLPAGLPLLIAGIGGLALAGRKRKAA